MCLDLWGHGGFREEKECVLERLVASELDHEIRRGLNCGLRDNLNCELRHGSHIDSPR